MRFRYYALWQDDLDERLLAAIRFAADGAEVQLRDTWMGLPKDRGDDAPWEDVPSGALAVEWDAVGPGAAMQLCVFGRVLGDDVSQAQFGRRLALALGRPLLFSDCHLFPLTYMMAREDGAIVHVVIRDDDAMSLLPDDPADPDYWERDVLFAPGAALPATPDSALDAQADPPGQCVVFGGGCPKRKFRCVSVRG
jgi:hypothetical protein